jgi:hypothetical protein
MLLLSGINTRLVRGNCSAKERSQSVIKRRNGYRHIRSSSHLCISTPEFDVSTDKRDV